MRIIAQRVSKAQVTVDNMIVGQIEQGLCLFVAINQLSSEKDADYLARKIVHSRIFEGEQDKMNLSLLDIKGQILSISQFTLYANTTKGNRPSFSQSATAKRALHLYQYFNQQLSQYGVVVRTGQFGAHMIIDVINDGPVTIIYDKLSEESSHE